MTRDPPTKAPESNAPQDPAELVPTPIAPAEQSNAAPTLIGDEDFLLVDDLGLFGPEPEPALFRPRPLELPAPEVDQEALLEAVAERELDVEIAEELRHEERERRSWFTFRRIVRALTVLLAVAIPVPLWLGREYYRLPLGQRPLHEWHDWLRPSGKLGLTCGLLGTGLLVFALAYVLRKSLEKPLGFAGLKRWMTAHVACAVLGTGLIVVHTGLWPHSVLGTGALLALGVVIASGIAGRYLLRFLPRTVETSATGKEAVERRLRVYENKLVGLGLAREQLTSQEPARARGRLDFLIPALVKLARQGRSHVKERKRLADVAALHESGTSRVPLLRLLLDRLCRERFLLTGYHELCRMVSAWRFLHRWFTILLIATATYHVLIAVKFGDLWILRGVGR